LDSLETDDGYCIIQEYKEAQPLCQSRSFTPDEVKQIAMSLLEILVYLQERRPPIIHRDIKPENVLIDDQLNVYLIDFGFAHIGWNNLTLSSVTAGTLGFMAPEYIYNKTLIEATDLYSLGAMLIALLTQTKSTAMDTLIDEDNKIAFKHLVPKLSLGFIEWLEKMTENNSLERYPNAQEALKALAPIALIRARTVELSANSLEFTATKPREKVTQTITIFNPTPETPIDARWEVAPHQMTHHQPLTQSQRDVPILGSLFHLKTLKVLRSRLRVK